MADTKIIHNRPEISFGQKVWNAAFKFPIVKNIAKKFNIKAEYFGMGGSYRHLFSYSYTGEKNLGELGPIKNYRIEYDILKMRSWQSYLESEITQTVINRFATWIIGRGLKLQAEPAVSVLEEESIKIDRQKFCKIIEARFNVFRKEKSVDYSSADTLDSLGMKAFKNAIIGGDVLVVLRYEEGEMTIQLIDGAHIQSPIYGTEYIPQVLANGNRIMNGIEVDERRQVVAYHVRAWQNPNQIYKFTRIPAKSSTGLDMAFMVFGMDFRLDNIRGLPLISTVMETLKKLERYKEATVGSAEERQKIPYFIKHGVTSTGENPLQKIMARAHDAESPLNDNLPIDVTGKHLANTVAVSTNKTVFNMPNDSELVALESKNELHFKDFYTVNIDIICASLGIPPNVAMSKYDSNYSSSRAAIKDWEHTIGVERARFHQQFYQPIYNFWLHINILLNKINAPGYLEAFNAKDNFILGAYRMCRFVGSPVPHIDPVKEVTAERLKMGDLAINMPLTTLEASTEVLNGGESENNMEQFSEELAQSKKLKLVGEMPPLPIPPKKPIPKED